MCLKLLKHVALQYSTGEALSQMLTVGTCKSRRLACRSRRTTKGKAAAAAAACRVDSQLL